MKGPARPVGVERPGDAEGERPEGGVWPGSGWKPFRAACVDPGGSRGSGETVRVGTVLQKSADDGREPRRLPEKQATPPPKNAVDEA